VAAVAARRREICHDAAVRWLLVWSAVLAAGCSGGGASPDARPADAPVDAVGVDAGPDAFDRCPGELTFTGDYVDWDSSEQSFHGIFDAELHEVDDPGNSARTAPNGRGVLCVTPGVDTDVAYSHPDYLPMVFSMDAAAMAAGPFSTKGLEPARADSLFGDELSLTRNPAAAVALIEVRRFPGGEPVVGATVTLGNGHDGVFTRDAAAAWQPGATITDDAWVLFTNVDGAGQVDGDGGSYGTTSVTVTPPDGTSCVGRPAIALGAGGIAATTFACQ